MKVVLVGGGTAGHVNPNFAIADLLKKHNHQVYFITTDGDFERSLFSNKNYKVYFVKSGKLRRYFDLKNFTDPIKVFIGAVQSIKILFELNPDVIFLKGGFTCVPVALAGFVLRKKLVLHESDSSLGLANRICSIFTSNVWYSQDHFKNPKPNFKHVKLPLNIKKGDPKKIQGVKNLNPKLKTLLVMGGSSGARSINNFVFANLNKLTEKFNLIHITGKINTVSKPQKTPKNYLQFNYIDDLSDIYAQTDLVLSRAGAISLSEYEYLGLQALLVPLPETQSRGDQLENAKSFKAKSLGDYVLEADLEINDCMNRLQKLQTKKTKHPHHENQSNQVFLNLLKNI